MTKSSDSGPKIPFNSPSFVGNEAEYMFESVRNGHISGNGPFTKVAERMLSTIHDNASALLTTSCTHALELSARLLNLEPGDEVIVPSFTFVSTASAYMWNGAKPVFADIRLDTLNIDPNHVRSLVTERTKAICIVHYAGVGADPFEFQKLSKETKIPLIEDNAHGLGATYGGKILGTFGAMSTLSFHETKNISCGEGGAIVLTDPQLRERAEILREKGTDRSRFLRGQVDKYTWIDNGSSWTMSDLLAAVLVGQLERLNQVERTRLQIWDRYFNALQDWAVSSGVSLPAIPESAHHSGHMFYLRMPSEHVRNRFITHMLSAGVVTVFHYQALNTSPEAIRIGSDPSECPNSRLASSTVVRLPIFSTLSLSQQSQVIEAVTTFRN